MTANTYQAFPSERVEAARDAIQKVWTRLERAALRAGQPAPTHPVLVEFNRRVVGECRACHGRNDAARIGEWCARDVLVDHMASVTCTGKVRGREVVDLVLEAPPARLAGWDFVAVVEPLDGGNLIRRVPGTEGADGELDAWRTGAVHCDHCSKKRDRKETFLVRATAQHPRAAATAAELDGETRTVVVGDIRQVGRQCLADFLGGESPAAIIASLQLDQLIRDAGGGDEEGGWSRCAGPEGHDALEYLAQVAAVIRIDGWTSRKQVEGTGRMSTSEIAMSVLSPLAKRTERERLAVTPADTERAAAALEYARALEGASDYEQNLRLIAAQPTVTSRHAGILASAISAYERHVGRQIERAQRAAAPSDHVGKLGEMVELELTIERVIDRESQYGNVHIHVMRDGGGNTIVWRTGTARMEPGATRRVRGKVKAHGEYNGVKQTELTRCKVLEAA